MDMFYNYGYPFLFVNFPFLDHTISVQTYNVTYVAYYMLGIEKCYNNITLQTLVFFLFEDLVDVIQLHKNMC